MVVLTEKPLVFQMDKKSITKHEMKVRGMKKRVVPPSRLVHSSSPVCGDITQLIETKKKKVFYVHFPNVFMITCKYFYFAYLSYDTSITLMIFSTFCHF